jgi:hypothetical protein
MNGIVKEITAVLYKSVGTTLYTKCDYVYPHNTHVQNKEPALQYVCLVWPFLSFGIRY